MSILQRYVLREMLGPLLLGLLVFTFVFLIGELFQLTELLLNSGVPALLAGELILLLLPGILSLTIPMAVLLAVLLGMGRLASDREILAIRTSGVNLLHICTPVLGLAVVLTGLMIWANYRLIPHLNQKSVDVGMQLHFHVLSAVPPGVSQQLDDEAENELTTFFYDERDPATGEMMGVSIRTQLPASQGKVPLSGKGKSNKADRNTADPGATNSAAAGAAAERKTSDALAFSKLPAEKQKKFKAKHRREKEQQALMAAVKQPLQEALIVAQSAHIVPNIEDRVLTFELSTGTMHISSPTDFSALDVIGFSKLSKGHVPTFSKTKDGLYKQKPREMSVPELRAEVKSKGNRTIIELWERISIPMACIAFSLVALPLGIYVRPRGKAIAFAISFLLILLYYGMLKYGAALGKSNADLAPFAIFFPNVALSVAGGSMLYRMIMK